MGSIYERRDDKLEDLLTNASRNDGATIVVPDLQRPFVWQPQQVVLLVDSLIRGWPFGTLLMWKVNPHELQTIPHREFWQVVDRATGREGPAVQRQDPPANYQMVLDGQQRVQSLILALCGSGWGFKLTDRDWVEQLTGNRPRGRKPRHPHWSKGTLCFNAEKFLREYKKCQDVISIDYRNVLEWAVTDPSDGQSQWHKPENYKDPLPIAFTEENTGSLVRLAEIWSLVPPRQNFKEKDFRQLLGKFFDQQKVPQDKREHLLSPMAELMTTLRDLKLSSVTYLELQPYNKDLWTEDEYNSAIVNIFTRLNTAGRTLTREEITFAWLKVGWKPEATGNRPAGQCFKELLEEVHSRGVPISMDNLVRGVSFLWSVCYNAGNLLSDQDLLKGNTVQPMADNLADNWNQITTAIEEVLDAIAARDIDFGRNAQFSSFYSVTILYTWYFLGIRWMSLKNLRATEKDGYKKKLQYYLHRDLDRWLICSHWAGRWSGASPNAISRYAKELNADLETLLSKDNSNAAGSVLADRLNSLVEGVVEDALEHVEDYNVEQRSQVAWYNSFLWIWHRLNESRWANSKIPLRNSQRRKCRLEVDHVVPYGLWAQKVHKLWPDDPEWREEQLQKINSLGNCLLLEKTFNISKGSKDLGAFLKEVHEFQEGQQKIDDWANPLLLRSEMLYPTKTDVEPVLKALQERDRQMREEIKSFVRGEKKRVDVNVT